MRTITTATRDRWLSGDFTGPNRAIARVTVQKMHVLVEPYQFKDRKTEHKKRGKFRSLVFGQTHVPLELPNLASIRWSRSVTADVAEATLRFYNTRPLPLGATPDTQGDFDQPGFYTAERGRTTFGGTRWGHTTTGWQRLLAPDRLLRTYEGYGWDASVAPEADPNMYPSGVWLIDEVDYTDDGMIEVRCRDLGRSLLDHIVFPPVAPWSEYPIWFERYHKVDNPDKLVTKTGDKWLRPNYETDSNQPYVGTGITDAGLAYVQPNGAVYGHHGSDAFDADRGSYWLSVGNKPTWSSAYEYVQGTIRKAGVGAFKVKVRGGPYVMYLSVQVNGRWQGTKLIPYGSRVIDTHADIPYVKRVSVPDDGDVTVKLPKVYKDVTRVRVTFSHLWDSGLGVNYRYRAAVKDVQVLATTSIQVEKDMGQRWEGHYQDFTDVVKWLCAWGGFFRPRSRRLAYILDSDGTKYDRKPTNTDPVLGDRGRVWGFLEDTGTNGPAKLGIDIFDKRPLMDGIAHVREIIGFNFWINETGGVHWRAPNVYTLGCDIYPVRGGSPTSRVGASEIITLNERTTLLGLRARLSSRNVRERVFVGNIAGKIAAVAKGYNPNPSGLRRVAGWTDQHFETQEECQIMADMITMRQAFTYRENTIDIRANPAIQIDDQVRVFERVTEEGYYHYVQSIDSDWDLETGVWRYSLGLHWLGEQPFKRWAFDPEQMAEITKRYLKTLGKL